MSGEIIRSRFQILNEFRYSKSKGESLGMDYSSFYSFDKNINLYIYHPELDSLITFKCFLEDFSIDFDIQYDEKQTVEGSIPKNIKNFNCNYKLKMNVPSPSVNDARVNDAKFAELNRMVVGATYAFNNVTRYIDQPKRILMSNLIHNGSYIKGLHIKSKSQILKYGMLCRFNSVDWAPDVEMGFFEYDERLWAKSYSFSLDLAVNFEPDVQINRKKSFSGFLADGTYEPSDIKKWPFGV